MDEDGLYYGTAFFAAVIEKKRCKNGGFFMAVINVTAEASDSTRTYIKTGGHSIVIDEPPLFGGEDTAPSPVAMFLASLAGCINAIGQWVSKEMVLK